MHGRRYMYCLLTPKDMVGLVATQYIRVTQLRAKYESCSRSRTRIVKSKAVFCMYKFCNIANSCLRHS